MRCRSNVEGTNTQLAHYGKREDLEDMKLADNPNSDYTKRADSIPSRSNKQMHRDD